MKRSQKLLKLIERVVKQEIDKQISEEFGDRHILQSQDWKYPNFMYKNESLKKIHFPIMVDEREDGVALMRKGYDEELQFFINKDELPELCDILNKLK